jgi:hypothetical protein
MTSQGPLGVVGGRLDPLLAGEGAMRAVAKDRYGPIEALRSGKGRAGSLATDEVLRAGPGTSSTTSVQTSSTLTTSP